MSACCKASGSAVEMGSRDQRHLRTISAWVDSRDSNLDLYRSARGFSWQNDPTVWMSVILGTLLELPCSMFYIETLRLVETSVFQLTSVLRL